MTPDELHANHHRLYEERKAALLEQPKRTGRDKHIRRELWKKCHWHLKSHLRSPHGHRRFEMHWTLQDLEDLHARLHADD